MINQTFTPEEQEEIKQDHLVSDNPPGCDHMRAFLTGYHTDRIVWCPDCNEELTSTQIKRIGR